MQTAVTRPYWRVWTYETPAVVLGCSQRAYLDGARARLALGMELLQRPRAVVRCCAARGW